MANTTQMAPSPSAAGPSWARGLRISRWVLTILGGLAALLGALILFGPKDQYIGLGGDVSWRIGEIDQAWGWGLLIGGGLLLLVGILAFVGYHSSGGEAVSGSDSRSDLIVHAVAFVLVNAFIWAQDIATGDGVNYAYWITIPWGIGLAAHVAAYASGRRGSTRAT